MVSHFPSHAQEEELEASAALPMRGDVIDGKYRIEETLGKGGMAAVLAATHLHLDERVAIKVLLPQWAEDAELVERFMREGRAAIKIRSEHVVRVHDVGTSFGRPYLVLEYLQGKDLDALVAQNGPLPVTVAVDYLLQACEAIAEAHMHGIIHRDLKPANLFLTHRADGSACVKVLDFGISMVRFASDALRVTRVTAPQVMMGSPHYMSPEQMQSARGVDERSDIWALGAILHELISGAPPWKGDSVTALCANILRDPPPPLTTLRSDVPPAVEAVVLRCLQKDPTYRYRNVAELAAALADLGTVAARASALRIARILEGPADPLGAPWMQPESISPSALTVLSESQNTGAKPKKPGRLFGYLTGAAALFVVGSGIGWMIVQHDRAVHAAERAADEPVAAAPAESKEVPAPPPASAVELTSGHAPAPPQTGAPSAPQAATQPEAPAAAQTTTQTATPAAAPVAAPVAHSRRHPRRPHPARAIDTTNDSYAAPAPPPAVAVPAPTPTPAETAPAPAPSAAPPSADEVFDDRK